MSYAIEAGKANIVELLINEGKADVNFHEVCIYCILVYFGGEIFSQKCSKIPFAKNIFTNNPPGQEEGVI